MRAHVQKWGNSLALRIPKSLAEDSQLRQGTVVDLKLSKGRLIVERAACEPELTLERLLDGVTEENIHAEISTGRPVGRETL